MNRFLMKCDLYVTEGNEPAISIYKALRFQII